MREIYRERELERKRDTEGGMGEGERDEERMGDNERYVLERGRGRGGRREGRMKEGRRRWNEL